MEIVVDFLKENSLGSLATVEQNKPRVRPWGLMLAEDNRFYFCTANTKEVYRQLQQNPFIEFTATSSDMVTLRLSGEAIFTKDLTIKNKVLESNEMVKAFYQSPQNPVFEVFYIEHGTASLADFSGAATTHFNF